MPRDKNKYAGSNTDRALAEDGTFRTYIKSVPTSPIVSLPLLLVLTTDVPASAWSCPALPIISSLVAADTYWRQPANTFITCIGAANPCTRVFHHVLVM